LNKLIQGRTNEEIGKQLFILKETVNTQRRNMLAKWGVKNSMELINISITNGLV
jgi:DNA-binding NarL/FixJ family response regulator